MKKLFQKKNKNNKGFTLVETLIAISIFTISVVAMMSVLASGISNTDYAKKKIIAEYLAQEGIEYVRNLRDSAMITSSGGWAQFKTSLDSCISNGCAFDHDAPLASLASCKQLEYIANTGFYECGDTGSFQRKISVTKVGSPESQIGRASCRERVYVLV